MKQRKLEFHAISNGKLDVEDLVEKIASFYSKVDYIHLREKSWTAKQYVQAINLLREAGVPLAKIIVNDRVDVAVTKGVSGVQLTYHSLDVKSVRSNFPAIRIGKSVHSVAEAKEAEAAGADYVVYGHIFNTNSKKDLKARGIEALEKVILAVEIPVIAIGGISPLNIKEVVQAGVGGFAIMSGVFDAENSLEAVEKYSDRSV